MTKFKVHVSYVIGHLTYNDAIVREAEKPNEAAADAVATLQLKGYERVRVKKVKVVK